ncbi:MAG: hypothetical protein ACRDSS_08135 [Actinocrinis sp.]
MTSSAPAATVTPPSVTTTTSAGSPGTGVARAALHVAPSTGYRTSVFKFGFRAPAASGTREGVHSAYSLSVAGPSGSGCVSTHSLALPTVAQGAPVTVDVGPAQLGGDWCAGDWSARVAEVAGPRCAQGQACPQFLRLVAIVGPVSFRVAAAAAG